MHRVCSDMNDRSGKQGFGNWVADSALQRPGAVWGLTLTSFSNMHLFKARSGLRHM